MEEEVVHPIKGKEFDELDKTYSRYRIIPVSAGEFTFIRESED